MKKMKSFILNHRKLFTIVLILLGFFMIVLPQIILKHNIASGPSNKLSGIEIIAYSAETVSALYLMLGTIIAVWQYYISSQKHMEKIQRDQIQKAIDLAGYYKDNILSGYLALKLVYTKSGLQDILNNIPNEKIQSFDNIEMNELLNNKLLNEYNNIIKSEKFIETIFEVNQLLGLNLKGCETRELVQTPNNTPNKIRFEVNSSQLANDFFKNYVSNILNNAELFAMSFTHGIADESVIFQSIYPTYLELCNTLYYEIARCSSPGKAKLYTNVIKLYNDWKEKSKKQNEKAKDSYRSNLSDYGTIMNNEKMY